MRDNESKPIQDTEHSYLDLLHLQQRSKLGGDGEGVNYALPL